MGELRWGSGVPCLLATLSLLSADTPPRPAPRPRTPAAVVATQDAMHGKMLSVIQQLLARSARLLVVCNEGDAEVAELCHEGNRCALIRVPRVRAVRARVRACVWAGSWVWDAR